MSRKLVLLLIPMFVTACASADIVPQTPTPTPSVTPTITITPSPTSTPTQTITPTPTPMPSQPYGIICPPEYCYDGNVTVTSDLEIHRRAIQSILDAIKGSADNRALLEQSGISTFDDLETNHWILPSDLEFYFHAIPGGMKLRPTDRPLQLDNVEMYFVPIDIPNRDSNIYDLELISPVTKRLLFIPWYPDPEFGYERIRYGVMFVPTENGTYRFRYIIYMMLPPSITRNDIEQSRFPYSYEYFLEKPDYVLGGLNKHFYALTKLIYFSLNDFEPVPGRRIIYSSFLGEYLEILSDNANVNTLPIFIKNIK